MDAAVRPTDHVRHLQSLLPALRRGGTRSGRLARQALRHVVLPIIGPSVVGIGLVGFALSWDEIARTSQAVGYLNALPLELQGQTTTVTTPVIDALGTLITAVSWLVIAAALGAILLLRRRQARHGSDASQGLI